MGVVGGLQMPLGAQRVLHHPIPLPPWALGLPRPSPSPIPLPSGTCYSCNTESCSPQIRPAQGPSEERQPRARLLIKKLLLNFSCSLGGPAAAGRCKGMREAGDGDGHSILSDGAGWSFGGPRVGGWC